MQPAHILITVALAAFAAIALYSALVRFFDPLGTEAQARRERREAETAARADSRHAALLNLGTAVSNAVPLARNSEHDLSMRLARAGLHVTPAAYWGISLSAAVMGAAIGLALAVALNVSLESRLALAASFTLIGLVAPRLAIASRARARAEEIEASLPAALELLSVVVESGQTIERGIKELALRTSGPLADEFAMVDRDITRYHKKTSDALSDMSKRCNVKSVAVFCTSVTQALEQGSAIGRILKTQAQISSENYYMAVEEKSNKITVKMSIATIFFLLPPVVIISIGPAIINLVSNAGELAS